MRTTALVLLFMLAGCAHYNYPFSVDGLKADGYKRSDMVMASASGEKRPVDSFQVWSKETKDDARRLSLCIVPQVGSAGYTWRATVTVDDKAVWSHDTGGRGSSSAGLGIRCVTSDPLPEGRISWTTGYTYWH